MESNMKRDYTEPSPVQAIFELTTINKHTGKTMSFNIPYNPMLADIINVEHPDYMTFIDVKIENTI